MTIVLVGLNHRTASVELREKMALTPYGVGVALDQLRDHVQEGMILSTCNRLEIYALVEGVDAALSELDAFMADLHDMSKDQMQPHLYHKRGQDAIRHLMRVAAGLDSMILGEPQILGQVTQAFGEAQASSLTGPILSNLAARAIHAGKRARAETEISRYTTSVSHAGAILALDHVHAESPNILIMGAGEMARLAAKSLAHRDGINLACLNRTLSRAQSLAQELDAITMDWHQLEEGLVWADAVICATGAPHTVIHADIVQRSQAQRADRPLAFVDIAVPRDVEVAVEDIPGVLRFDIDDLNSIVDSNTAHRESAIPQVEAILEEENSIYYEWYHSRAVTPVIKDLRRWAVDVAQMEVDQALNKLGDVDDHTTEVVNRLAHRLVNKLLHKPTVRLRGQAAESNGHCYAQAVSDLFGLDASSTQPGVQTDQHDHHVREWVQASAQNGNGHYEE
ncbi:MAG: glutamyl-tRNA reductase [Anaerolineaceae bacterium]|nr:glutamyl-tRNA reductase [Anaerolineaceae bacterium]